MSTLWYRIVQDCMVGIKHRNSVSFKHRPLLPVWLRCPGKSLREAEFQLAQHVEKSIRNDSDTCPMNLSHIIPARNTRSHLVKC